MAADWEEVKRLAADFQRAQLSTSVQRLSERNCIEIVKKLIELKLIDVIFTNDGKEYITPKHLQKEILDELTVAGGRINLVDLAHTLNVDLFHVQGRCNDLIRTDHSLQIVLGQLISRSYLDSLSEEINDRLQQEGHLTFGDITKLYDLPPEFLESVVYSRLGSIIKGHCDPTDKQHIFTDTYVTKHTYHIRGALSAVTRPIQLSTLISAYQFPEKLLYGIVDDMIKNGRLAGTLVGGRSERTSYIPDIYSRSQNSWVDSCYQQNGYLEFDAVSRLGIADAKTYIKRRYKDENLVFLKSICVGQGILAQVEAAVEEVAATGSWTDVMPLLPSVCTPEDGANIIQVALKSRSKGSASVQALLDTIVVSDAFIDTCMRSFDPLMTAKAELDPQKGVVFLEPTAASSAPHKHAAPAPEEEVQKHDKKEERRKKATGGKSGGGTQGRETKTRSTKSKKRPGGRGKGDQESDSDDAAEAAPKPKRQAELEFMTLCEVQDQLEQLSILKDCPKELSLSIAEKIHRPLTRKYQEVAKSIFLSSSASSGASRRKTHADLQEKLTGLLANVQQFERGLKVLPEDLQSQLAKYLLKTLCTDIVNIILGYLVAEHGISGEQDPSCGLAPEARQKLIQKLPADIRGPVLKLHNSLSAKTTEDFMTDVNVVLGPGICDMIIRSDKKKERQVLQGHRTALLSQLGEASEPALCLHLAVLLVLQTQTQRMIHASGKFVPQLVAFLKTHVPLEIHCLLQQAQELVLKQFTLDEESEEKKDVVAQLAECMPKLKELGATYKRQSVSED
ncbi:E3 UFM1-protein ligase 1-like [Ornithodoros turicata]|uniref:E3 UFM1-protein ligase 1-like n=1 Tax=Ornithodoros turicata TaxID=34597 RepID=UPI00313A431F